MQGLGAGPEGLSDLCLLESCQPCPQCLTLVRREVVRLGVELDSLLSRGFWKGFEQFIWFSMVFPRVSSRFKSFQRSFLQLFGPF